MQRALFGWRWCCGCWSLVRTLPRSGAVQKIIYIRRIRVLQHDRHRDHEEIVVFHRDVQSLLQIWSLIILGKAHVILYTLGKSQRRKKGQTRVAEKRTSWKLAQSLGVIFRSGKGNCFIPGGLYEGVFGMATKWTLSYGVSSSMSLIALESCSQK